MIGNGEISVNEFGSNVTLDTFNNRIFNHEVFGISRRFAITSGGTNDFIFDATNVTVDTLVLLPISITGFDAGPLFMDLYVDPVYTGGTAISGIDRNFCDTPATPEGFFVEGATVSDNGTLTPVQFLVPSNGVPAVSQLAGSVKGDLIFKLCPGKKYLIKSTNQTATTGSGLIALNWFEV